MPDANQGLSLILPSGDFPGEGGVVPFRDDIHDKYLITIPKQYVILLRIERGTLDLFKNNRLLNFWLPKCFPIAKACKAC